MNRLLSPELVTLGIVYGCLTATLIGSPRINLNEVMSFAAGGYYGYLQRLAHKE